MTDQPQNQTPPHSLAMHLSYAQASDVHAGHVQLFGQLQRKDVHFQANIKQPILFRDVMSALFGVVSSDYRYVPKDRAAYAAYLQLRRGQQHQGLFAAQRAYFDWLVQNDPLALCILDPVINVHAHGVSFEVFSRDEGCYAHLCLKPELFENIAPTQYGTTHIDYSEALIQGIESIRSHRQASLSIGQQATSLAVSREHTDAETILEKQINVPVSWLRGFLQVQSAAQLAQDRFSLQPIDLYNVLYHLRMHADIKGKRRGLVIELIPQQSPNLIIEPSGTVISSKAAPYQGRQAKLIRLWGRRRLALLQRALPHTDHIEVCLLGQGMPSYWTLSGKGFHLTLAMTGFSAANWSQALNFDLLVPRTPHSEPELIRQVVDLLHTQGALGLTDLAQQLTRSIADTRQALQEANQHGWVMFDLATALYRHRPLTPEPLDMAHFRYRHPAEQQAYDLISRTDAIRDLSIRVIPTEGIEIGATVEVVEDKRSYNSKLKLNEEGMVSKAECSCHQFLQHGLSQGACAHLIALRMAYAHDVASRDPKAVVQETRLFSRRRGDRVEQIQLTLHQKRLMLQTGTAAASKRQQLAFNQLEQAQQAYFNKIQQLETAGFIENTLG